MLIKFMGGRGGGGPIAAYLVDASRAGREEAAPEVLRGDIERTRELIDSIDRKWTYTTGVISFAIEDAPDEDQQLAVMDDFERLAFAGMDPEQYDITWVRHSHTEGGRTELHFLTPRMELTSGKALNIAPPGWERSYAPLRDAWNHEQGWARPDDPDRARSVQLDRQTPERAQTREAVTAFLENRIVAGEIEDWVGIVTALEDAGFEIPRQGKDYITVADPETEARFRLKGRIYEQNWTRAGELDRAAAREAAPGPGADRGVDLERAQTARRELEQIVAGRARRHGERYAREVGADAARNGRDRDPAEALAALDRLELGGDRALDLCLAVDGHELGAVRSEDGAEGEIRGTPVAGRSAGADTGHDPADQLGGADLRGRARGVGGERLQRDALHRTAGGLEDDEQPDDVRAGALGRVRELGRSLREIGASLGRYGRAAVEGVRSFLGADRDAQKEADRAGRTLERCDHGLERTIAANLELDQAGERVAARTRELEHEHSIERDSGYGLGL
ncbi:relaxase/mobilization nuclease domain-containing protein [Palleronia rufa]|uniref:relaxase/mobilization nuclease domain-containing protein n=1 Tax=Palleronia rufa TaxID=1530186 RepID=UPI0009DEA419|nr:relaxase/mobilization nuclease domain-containing protein [Palleronia rufa]